MPVAVTTSRRIACALLYLSLAAAAQAQLTTDYQSLIQGTASLQNYWNFEDLGAAGDLTTVADVQGGKDGTVIGTVESQAGLIGYAGYFPGDSDSATFNNLVQIVGSGSDASFDLSGTSFTIEALVKTDTLPADNWTGIVTKGDSAWRIARNSGNDYIQGSTNGLAGGVNNAFHDLDNDVWHYLAMRYDTTTDTVSLTFDDATVSSSVGADALLDLNTFDVMIGGNAEKPEREWLGFIDEVAIYTDALTDSEIGNRVNLLNTDPNAIDEAAIAYWTGSQATGTFDNAAGWDSNAPGPGDTVVLGKGGEVDFTGGSVEVANLEVGSTTDLIGFDSNGTGTLNMQAGELLITGSADGTIGKGTTGEVYQTGGSILFMGEDYELGEDANGHGTHTMTGGLLQIGGWEEDPRFDGGWFMTNDNSSGDDLSLGRERNDNPAETAVGILDMSGDSEVRVSNDVFLDVGVGELSMADNAVMRVGDDFRAASADRGEATMDMSGSSNLRVEGRFSIADSWDSTADVTLSGDSLVEVGRYLVVAGQDNLNESGVGVLNIEDNATVSVGAFKDATTGEFEKFIYRGDVGGDLGSPNEGDRVADEHAFFIGSGNGGVGSGTVNQNGAGSTVSIGRQITIGDEAVGVYNLRGGLLEVRGDAPISGVDFASGLSDDSGFTSGGGDVIIGNQPTADGTLNIEGGELATARDMIVGFEGAGTLRVEGGDATIRVDGDFSFGGDFAGSAGGEGVLEIVLTDASDHSAIEVTGDSDVAPGDLLIFDGEVVPDFGGGYRPAIGDYSSDPLEWKIIDYAGGRSGEFELASGYEDGTVNGVIWDIRYDDGANEVYLQAVEVLTGAANFGDFNGDGVVDSVDYTVWRENFGEDASVLLGNGSGGATVSDQDYLVWQQNYGRDYNTGSTSAVPEPAGLAIVLLAGCGVAANRSRRRVA